MFETIQNKLKEIEEQKEVTIHFFACESGSRDWGFHSPEWYLSIDDKIDDKKNFIALPVDEVFDIAGYNIRKMLRLSGASNSKIYEWIQSPVLYRKNESLLQAVRSTGTIVLYAQDGHSSLHRFV